MKFLCLIPIVSGELNENCDSIEAGRVCEDDCVAEFAKCAVDCGSNNECVIDLGSLCFPKLKGVVVVSNTPLCWKASLEALH